MERWKNNPKAARKLLITMIVTVVVFGSLTAVVMAKNNAGVKEIRIGVTAGKKLTAKMGGKNLAKRTYQIKKNDKIRIRKGSKRISGLTYRSSDKKVVAVSKKGVVTTKKNGTAKVTIRAKYKKKKLKTWIIFKVKREDTSAGKPQASKTPNQAGQTAGSTGTANQTAEPIVQPTESVNQTAKPTRQPSGGEADKPVVYMTRKITSEELMKVYQATAFVPTGKAAVKVSTGEPPHSHYLDPALMKELVQSIDGTIVECNTAYGGSRAGTAMHRQVAEEHGFTAIADVDIMDEEGSMTLPVSGGSHLSENFVGSHFADYNSFVVLSHFKGHAMAGFGGAIKNISIGIASSEGKAHIHSGGIGGNMWGGSQNDFLESMAEAGKAVSDSLDHGKNIIYVNVMNNLSVDCDCDGNPAEPEMDDIGILASADPVALDQACVDLVYEQKNGDGKALVERIESRNGLLTLKHAEEIGLGSRSYELQEIH